MKTTLLSIALTTSTIGLLWVDMSSSPDARKTWREFRGDWHFTDAATLDPGEGRRLIGVKNPSGAVMLVGGRASDLISRAEYDDVEVRLEFMIARRSNAGVKLMGLYEIQIFDSYGKNKLTGADCGGIYPRGEEKPSYHTIDDGVPPSVNACKPAGEWQQLDIQFQAPKFDGEKKVSSARFVRVALNGQVVHMNVPIDHPTGANWRLAKEKPAGPLLLQADHGSVAYRNVRVRPLPTR